MAQRHIQGQEINSDVFVRNFNNGVTYTGNRTASYTFPKGALQVNIIDLDGNNIIVNDRIIRDGNYSKTITGKRLSEIKVEGTNFSFEIDY